MDHISFCTFRKPLQILSACAAAAVVLLGVFYFSREKSIPTDPLIGKWYSPQEPILELVIDEDTININGLTFCYEKTFPMVSQPSRQSPQSFIINGEAMGPLPGSCFVEKGRLYLTVNSEEKIFLPHQGDGQEPLCSAD